MQKLVPPLLVLCRRRDHPIIDGLCVRQIPPQMNTFSLLFHDLFNTNEAEKEKKNVCNTKYPLTAYTGCKRLSCSFVLLICQLLKNVPSTSMQSSVKSDILVVSWSGAYRCVLKQCQVRNTKAFFRRGGSCIEQLSYPCVILQNI